MNALLESVPNVSEGRRSEVVDALAAAIASVPGAFLLDRSSDPDHNRSVFTLAGSAEAVCRALEALVARAIETIDMETHRGEHPRIGAVDVVPFVPLGATSMAEAVEVARAFGRRIAERFELPVYLYGEAALRPDRVKLADIRRGQYEGLKREIGQRGREPDFGPPRMHPRAGAVAVGARPFLIAWNVDLDTTDVEVARRVARRVRESGGGLPKVQANGFWIAERGRAQVSMNLLDFRVTPIWRVWEAVAELAAEEGVAPAESELIGLAPLAAFLDVADRAGAPSDAPLEARLQAAARAIRLRDFRPDMALELRLAAAMEAAGVPVSDPDATGGAQLASDRG
jgi:glutamate formiminotransferase